MATRTTRRAGAKTKPTSPARSPKPAAKRPARASAARGKRPATRTVKTKPAKKPAKTAAAKRAPARAGKTNAAAGRGGKAKAAKPAARKAPARQASARAAKRAKAKAPQAKAVPTRAAGKTKPIAAPKAARGKATRAAAKPTAKAAPKPAAKATKPRRHVIVGAGTAGYNAIRTLRQLGSTDEIALVSAEPPYSRMVLPYYLEGGISEAHTQTLSPDQLETWGVTTHFGRRAAKLDTRRNVLTLDNDDELPYDDLLIATGSSAARLPLPGADSEGVYSFWTLADAKGLNALIGPDSHVVMVGAGFIAFTILNGVIQRARKVTIVEVAPRILPRMVDDAAARMVSRWLEARGVTLRTSARLARISERNGRKALSFQDGSTLEADAVVMATGIRTNLDWVQDSGITIRQGIVVDDHLRSNVRNVYAAGDVAEGRNRLTGKAEVHAIEPTAMEHGRVVGANMAGRNVSYPGSLMMNIVGVAGLDIASFGSWDDAGAEVLVSERTERSSYRKYLFDRDRLVGAVYVGTDTETWAGNELGMLKGLVQSGRRLGAWKDYLKQHPFDVKKPYLATGTVSALIPSTVLGQATPSPRA